MKADQLGDNHRFVIEDKLGAGGMGVVYRARDRETGGAVALKLLRRADGATLYRFKKEFRALSDLAHPNLIHLYELQSVGDQWFFTMELIDGVSLLEWIRPGAQKRRAVGSVPDDGPVTLPTMQLSTDGSGSYRPVADAPIVWDRVRPALRQLAIGVSALHDAGKLHRDIKPSNVLVTKDGHLTLCDFGLVADVDAPMADQTVELSITGTPAYMSPEQAASEPLTQASDWYSVGALMYQLLSGHLPFDEGDLRMLLARKRSEDPPPPSTYQHDIPADLEDLCVRLLAREPGLRPTGPEVLAILGAEAHPVSSQRVPLAAPFVGREDCLESLRGALEDSREHAVGVYVRGPSGIGKTALMSTFLREARNEHNAVVLRGRCYEHESMPHKALDNLVDALSTYLLKLDPETVEALVPREITPLARMFPVLRRVPAIAEPRMPSLAPPDPQEFRRRAFGALRHLLGTIAARRPVVLAIDDLQWGDVDSADFLHSLVHHPLAPSVLLVCCYRSEDEATSPLLCQMLERTELGAERGDLRSIDVQPLTRRETQELAARIAGEQGRERAASILKESGGNPFFVTELAHAGVGRDDTGPVRLDRVLLDRMEVLDARARALLAIVCIAGRPLPLPTALRAAGLDTEGGALSVLRADRLIRTRQLGDVQQIEPYHDRIRSTVHGRLASGELAESYGRLAAALEDTDDADPQTMVEYWRAAGDVPKAGRYALIAAERAEEAMAFHRAARYYAVALELLELSDVEARNFKIRRADALAHAGVLAEAAALYMSAAEESEITGARELRRKAIEQYLRGGHLEEGLGVTREVLDEMGIRMPKSKRALIAVLWQRIKIRLRGLKFKERKASEISADELQRIDLYWSLASGLTLVEPMLGKYFQMKHLLAALNAGEPQRVGLALAIEVGYLGISGGNAWEKVSKLYERTAEFAERMDYAHAIGLNHGCCGVAAFLCGHWAVGAENCAKSHHILRERCTGVAWEADVAQMFHIASLLYLGELAELVRLVPLYLRDALERGDMYAAMGHRAWRSNIAWLAMDQPDEARRQAELARLPRSDGEYHLHHYYEMLSSVHIALYEGNAALAVELVEENRRPLEKSLLLRIQTVRVESLYLRGRAAMAVGDDETAAKLAKQLDKAGVPWASVLGAIVGGGALAIVGKRQEAIACYARAAQLARECDMKLHAAVADWRRGELMIDDAGTALVESARSWFVDQSVANPERFVALWAPTPTALAKDG